MRRHPCRVWILFCCFPSVETLGYWRDAPLERILADFISAEAVSRELFLACKRCFTAGMGYLRHRGNLGLRMSSLPAVLGFSLARLGIKRGHRVLALEVYSGSRGGMHWKQGRRFSARFTAPSSSLPVARCSGSWPWSSVWRATPRLS